MALAVPTAPTRYAGSNITAAVYKADVTDSVAFLANPPVATLTVTTPQAGPASSGAPNAALQFDTEVVDTYNGHSTSTNNSRYTAVVAGRYKVRAAVCWNPNSTGARVIQFYKNGSAISYAQAQLPASPATNFSIPNLEARIDLAVGDYVEAWVAQNSGGALAIVAAGTTMQILWEHASLL
ncbi:hypothetical protein [Kitasatospora cineracea]|uniref:hypothetical protein n=1 Tax=Kitasatospora cineracea TaxID=88074 RepID=UPI0036CDFA1D